MTEPKPFEPFVALITERHRPSNAAIFGVIGGPDRYLKFRFNPALKGADLHSFVLAEMEQRLDMSHPDQVPTMGRVMSYVANYRPDFAQRFDMEGNLVATLAQAYYPGETRIIMKGRDVTEPLQEIFGTKAKKK
jgi:hypothetical protein